MGLLKACEGENWGYWERAFRCKSVGGNGGCSGEEIKGCGCVGVGVWVCVGGVWGVVRAGVGLRWSYEGTESAQGAVVVQRGDKGRST